ncbi:MAG: 3-phosphoshikimate 1-carboxyvinyltransferase, partial [Allobaculum sp.]|nr:3-phosphoshikimate 1-carboxyvinyltransferase [Allobaculum sp.]
NDHRVVMAMSIFGLCAKSPSIIQGAQAIAKSYPTFFDDLKSLGANVQEIA